VSLTHYGTARAIQNEIHAALRALSWFADIALVKMRDEDWESVVKEELAAVKLTSGKKGVCIYIGVPDLGAPQRDVMGTISGTEVRAFYPAIRVQLQIEEATVENKHPVTGTGKPAQVVGEAVVAALQRQRTSDSAPRYCSGPQKLESLPASQPALSVDYLVELTTEGWATALLPTATPYYP